MSNTHSWEPSTCLCVLRERKTLHALNKDLRDQGSHLNHTTACKATAVTLYPFHSYRNRPLLVRLSTMNWDIEAGLVWSSQDPLFYLATLSVQGRQGLSSAQTMSPFLSSKLSLCFACTHPSRHSLDSHLGVRSQITWNWVENWRRKRTRWNITQSFSNVVMCPKLEQEAERGGETDLAWEVAHLISSLSDSSERQGPSEQSPGLLLSRHIHSGQRSHRSGIRACRSTPARSSNIPYDFCLSKLDSLPVFVILKLKTFGWCARQQKQQTLQVDTTPPLMPCQGKAIKIPTTLENHGYGLCSTPASSVTLHLMGIWTVSKSKKNKLKQKPLGTRKNSFKTEMRVLLAVLLWWGHYEAGIVGNCWILGRCCVWVNTEAKQPRPSLSKNQNSKIHSLQLFWNRHWKRCRPIKNTLKFYSTKGCQGVWYIHAYINSYPCTHTHYIHIICSNIQSTTWDSFIPLNFNIWLSQQTSCLAITLPHKQCFRDKLEHTSGYFWKKNHVWHMYK